MFHKQRLHLACKLPAESFVSLCTAYSSARFFERSALAPLHYCSTAASRSALRAHFHGHAVRHSRSIVIIKGSKANVRCHSAGVGGEFEGRCPTHPREDSDSCDLMSDNRSSRGLYIDLCCLAATTVKSSRAIKARVRYRSVCLSSKHQCLRDLGVRDPQP
jgi:hypothetical protein